MTTSARVVGVDPGPIPGVVVLNVGDNPAPPSVFQTDAGSVLWLVRALLLGGPIKARKILAVERFVVGTRAGRSSTPAASGRTRDMVGALTELGESLGGVAVVRRCAAEVMPWASDKRLIAAELFEVTRGMPHARAASRHALFAAVKDGNLSDPLSSRGASE